MSYTLSAKVKGTAVCSALLVLIVSASMFWGSPKTIDNGLSIEGNWNAWTVHVGKTAPITLYDISNKQLDSINELRQGEKTMIKGHVIQLSARHGYQLEKVL